MSAIVFYSSVDERKVSCASTSFLNCISNQGCHDTLACTFMAMKRNAVSVHNYKKKKADAHKKDQAKRAMSKRERQLEKRNAETERRHQEAAQKRESDALIADLKRALEEKNAK